MDSDIHWVKRFPAEYSSVVEGIPQLLRPIWDELQVHPIYFVSPEILYEESCVQVLKSEIAAGAVIGAHLHPEYIDPGSIFGEEMGEKTAQFPCFDYSDKVEKEKLENLTLLIEQKLGVKPTWYRAARFGADTATIQSLRALGYQYDSSVTPGIDWRVKGGPNHKNAQDRGYFISQKDIYAAACAGEENGIYECPVTILGKRFGFLGKFLPEHWIFYRWLRPTHMTGLELKGMIRQLAREGRSEAVMMFHSMEVMVNKTPYVRNPLMQKWYLRRLRKALECAKKEGYRL